MSLFQNSVLNKYLKTLNPAKVKSAHDKYVAFFQNETIIQNIKDDKEEQFQYGFLQVLFDQVLDYTINPNPDFNLTTEFKNLRGAKKADGAILKDGKAIGVIELKSTKTKDLVNITEQAFGYKNNHKACDYIITSNFEKLRFFISDAVEYIDFDLFTLTLEQFQLLYLCLQKDQILSGVPLKIKLESTVKEEDITKKLYKDYSAFKKTLFNDMVLNNPDIDKMVLFEKSQKLLDRFLFIFFAEDKGLLPPNSISEILKRYEVLISEDFEKPLYDIFKQYFGYIDKGRDKKGKKAEIFGYNGGLFKPDEILDVITISDAALIDHTKTLTAYDFDSEVDVNILGHIFEHSLNEIDAMAAELSGEAIDKSKTKRKKDGVFYTPKYITKYIVDNTVGKLANEQKEALGIKESEYTSNKNKATKKKLLDSLESYRAYLLTLTICDPACGSGAFLNQALDYLINEHRYIDELQTKLLGGSIVLSDITNDILEKNIYGVDINAESANIARLSLWLRTAQKGRALTSLNNNIKCGNSLIDDPEVAGTKAFNWENEFPEVFANGGFDIVIGNPPYVRVQSLKEHYYDQTIWLEKNYESATNKYDLYALFTERSIKWIKEKGLVSFILPHKFLVADFGVGLRNYLAQNKYASNIIHFGSNLVFKEASTYTCILNLDKSEKDDLKFRYIKPENISTQFNFDTLSYKFLSSEKWNVISNTEYKLIEKISSLTPLKDMCNGIYQGIITTGDDIFMLDGVIKENIFTGYSKELGHEVKLEAGILKKVLKGQDIKRYLPLNSSKYLIYPHELNSKNNTVPIEEAQFKTLYPLAYDYLLNFKDSLIKKKIRYKTNPKHWYSLHRSRDIKLFENDFVITPQLQNHPSFTIKETDVYPDAGGYLIQPIKNVSSDLLLAILNSSILWFYIKNTSSEYAGGYFYFKTKYLENFGLPAMDQNNLVSDMVKSQLSKNKLLNNQIEKTLALICSKFTITTPSKKLNRWYELSFAQFINELKKQKIKLTLKDESEWLEYLELEKKQTLSIQTEISRLDKEIDQMVYLLYNLTDEEIAIVEAS